MNTKIEPTLGIPADVPMGDPRALHANIVRELLIIVADCQVPNSPVGCDELTINAVDRLRANVAALSLWRAANIPAV